MAADRRDKARDIRVPTATLATTVLPLPIARLGCGTAHIEKKMPAAPLPLGCLAHLRPRRPRGRGRPPGPPPRRLGCTACAPPGTQAAEAARFAADVHAHLPLAAERTATPAGHQHRQCYCTHLVRVQHRDASCPKKTAHRALPHADAACEAQHKGPACLDGLRLIAQHGYGMWSHRLLPLSYQRVSKSVTCAEASFPRQKNSARCACVAQPQLNAAKPRIAAPLPALACSNSNSSLACSNSLKRHQFAAGHSRLGGLPRAPAPALGLHRSLGPPRAKPTPPGPPPPQPHDGRLS